MWPIDMIRSVVAGDLDSSRNELRIPARTIKFRRKRKKKRV